MVLQKLLSLLMSHPTLGPQLINKVADARPIRWAAKLTASIYLRGKSAIEQQVKDPKVFHKHGDPTAANFQQTVNASRFKQNFINELKKEWGKTQGGKDKQ